MNWLDQAAILLVLTLILAVAACARVAASRYCGAGAIGLFFGALVTATGALALLEWIDHAGPGALSWIPPRILFGWPGDLMELLIDLAPSIGAIGGVTCAMIVARLRRTRASI